MTSHRDDELARYACLIYQERKKTMLPHAVPNRSQILMSWHNITLPEPPAYVCDLSGGVRCSPENGLDVPASMAQRFVAVVERVVLADSGRAFEAFTPKCPKVTTRRWLRTPRYSVNIEEFYGRAYGCAMSLAYDMYDQFVDMIRGTLEVPSVTYGYTRPRLWVERSGPDVVFHAWMTVWMGGVESADVKPTGIREVVDPARSGHETKCSLCGRYNPVWFTDNEIWNRVFPEGGVVCPICFITSAENHGIRPTAWKLVPEVVV